MSPCSGAVALPETIPFSYEFEIIMIVIAIVTSFNGFTQWRTILVTDSDAGVSASSWAMNAVGNFFWIFYSLMTRDAPVFIASIVPFLGSMFVLHALFMRRKREWNKL